MGLEEDIARHAAGEDVPLRGDDAPASAGEEPLGIGDGAAAAGTMLTDTQMGLLWCGILVLIYLYTRQSPSSRSAGGTAGAGTATAAAAPAAAAAGHPLSEDEIRRAREARMARFGSAEGRERAQKIADEAVAAGITDRPAGTDARSAGRSDGGVRKRVGGFGQVVSGGSGGGGDGGGGGGDGGPGAGGSGDKYKKGQEYFGGDSTVFEGND